MLSQRPLVYIWSIPIAPITSLSLTVDAAVARQLLFYRFMASWLDVPVAAIVAHPELVGLWPRAPLAVN